MAALAEADEVDDDVLREGLTELEGELRDANHGLGILAVHVEDWGLNRPSDVGRVDRGSAVLRARREADLVVHDDMDAAAGTVALNLRHLEGLGDDALPGKGCIAVHEYRQDVEGPLAGELVLLRADDPFQHRVDRLEVRGVRGEVDGRGCAIR